jgi:hypothetical protein
MSPAYTTPKPALGTVVTWASHDIGYMTDIRGPSIKADTIDLSNHDSANSYKEFGLGLIDGGEISIDVRSIPGDTSGQKYFLDDLHARTERQVIITFPDGISKWTLNALPTGFDPSFNYSDPLDATLTMKVNGKPVFTNS